MKKLASVSVHYTQAGKAARWIRQSASTAIVAGGVKVMPSDELSLIIGVVHPRKKYEVELLDGSHRLAALILARRTDVEGYVGFY